MGHAVLKVWQSYVQQQAWSEMEFTRLCIVNSIVTPYHHQYSWISYILIILTNVTSTIVKGGPPPVGIMRLWSLKIYCKQNETPYALIIPTQQRFTAHLLYKTRLSKNLWRQAAISTKCFGLPVWVSYSCERVAWFCFHLRACVPGRCFSPSTLS